MEFNETASIVRYYRYRVSEKYRDFSGIGIDPSIGFWVSKIDTKNALGKMAIVDIEIAKNE